MRSDLVVEGIKEGLEYPLDKPGEDDYVIGRVVGGTSFEM